MDEVTVGNAVKKLLGGDLECGGNSCVRRIRTRSKKAQVGDSVANPTFAVVFLGGGDSGARFQRDPRKEGRNEISKIHLAVGGERGKVTLGAASLTSFPGASEWQRSERASERASESCVSERVRSKEEKPFPSAELKTR